MDYSEFTGEVQHRIGAGSQDEAVATIRATLTTLGERLHEGEATDLASPLPAEIGRYLEEAESGQRFDFDEFRERIAERAEIDGGDAEFNAQAVVALLADEVSGAEVDDLESQLPGDYADLFAFTGAGTKPWEEEQAAGE